MIVVLCDGCDKRILEDFTQANLVKRLKDLVNILCDTCARYGPKKYRRAMRQDAECICSHPYHRHFDGYENMAAVGCKYCQCDRFYAATREDEALLKGLSYD